MKKVDISHEDLARCITKFDDLRIDNLYENEDEFNHTFTKEFEYKMEELIDGTNRSFSRNYIKKFIIGFSITIICICTLSLSVEAVRVKVIQIIKQVQTEFTMFMFSKDKSNTNNKLLEQKNNASSLSKLPVPKYIPSGFKEVNRLESPLDTIIIYQDSDGLQIRYSVSIIDNNTITLDTEDAIVEDLNIGKNKAKYIEKNDLKQVFWNDNEFIYLVDCNLPDKSDLIKIAENIKK